MIRFQINVGGQMQLDRGIARFGEGVTDYRPVWPVIYDEFLAENKAQFASEGEAGSGKRWAPLTDNPAGKGYASWKARHYPGKPILQRTGDLAASLTQRGAGGAVFNQEPRAMTMGTSVPYALFHQKGTSKMVARPVVQLTEKFKRDVMRHIHEYLVIRATQCGFRTGMSPEQVSRISAAMAKYPGWQPAYMRGTA